MKDIIKNNAERMKSYLKPPFKYDKYWTYIRDDDWHMVAVVRWRWALQWLENWAEKQDSVWELIAELLNKHFKELPRKCNQCNWDDITCECP